MKCPKCYYSSGDDWRQCRGRCPMPMSPHYKKRILDPQTNIYVLVEEGDFPYVDGPFGREAMVFSFTDLDAAQRYRAELMTEGVIKPHQIKIMSMKMEGLLDLINEMTVFAREEYESGFEILLQEPEEVTTIYSSTQATTLN